MAYNDEFDRRRGPKAGRVERILTAVDDLRLLIDLGERHGFASALTSGNVRRLREYADCIEINAKKLRR